MFPITFLNDAYATAGALIRRTLGPRWYRCAIAALTIAPSVAAQGAPKGFIATTRVDSVYYHGDTAFVAQHVVNGVGSPVPIGTFALATPAPVVSQSRPDGRHWLLVRRDVEGRPGAVWAMPGSRVVAPGASSPSLTVGALGVPGVVSFWAVAVMPPRRTDDPDRETLYDPVASRAFRGLTVGIEPVPSGATPASMLGRTRDLVRRSCGELGWITNAGVCRSLTVKLDHARSSLLRGRRQEAIGDLTAFMNALDAQHGLGPGKHVRDLAYGLLRGSALYILSMRS